MHVPTLNYWKWLAMSRWICWLQTSVTTIHYSEHLLNLFPSHTSSVQQYYLHPWFCSSSSSSSLHRIFLTDLRLLRSQFLHIFSSVLRSTLPDLSSLLRLFCGIWTQRVSCAHRQSHALQTISANLPEIHVSCHGTSTQISSYVTFSLHQTAYGIYI